MGLRDIGKLENNTPKEDFGFSGFKKTFHTEILPEQIMFESGFIGAEISGEELAGIIASIIVSNHRQETK